MQMIFRSFLLLSLLTGCSDETVLYTPGAGNTVLPDGRVAYTLYTDAPPMEKPVTRTGTANEDDMAEGDFWVFVFDNTGAPADPTGIRLLEVAKAEPTSSTAPGPYKWVTTLKTRNHPVRVLMIANTPAQVYAANGTGGAAISATSFPVDMTYTDALAKLYTKQLEASLTAVPYTSPPEMIPMSSVKDFADLTAQTNLGTEGTPLRLPRVTAKITVDNATSANTNFVLVGANLHSAPASSCLAPLTVVADAAAFAKYEGTTAGNETTAIAPATVPNPAIPTVKESTASNPLYCYEANEADTKKLFLIVQGTYKGAITYYKMSIDRATNKTPITTIRRNSHYRLVIKECTATGYATYAEAIAAPPSNAMKYSIEVTDLSSHDILDNGQYFIGVSNSEYMVYADGALTDLVACTLNHNAPDGVTTRSITATTGITVTQSIGAANVPTDIKINLSETFTSPGSLTIKIGNLTKVITISRRPQVIPFAFSENAFATDDIVYGTVSAAPHWIGLSATPELDTPLFNEMESGKGGLYIQTQPNIQQSGGVSRTASVYLSRRSDKGRLKVDIQQAHLDTDDIEDGEDTALPFLPVVGAFWRNDQVAERLIRIARPSDGSIDGYWYAFVIQHDDRWNPDKGDGILMDLKMTEDPNVGWLPGSNEASVIDGYALETLGDNYRVTNGENNIHGYLDATTAADGIYFRIGLQKKHTPTASYPARYAVILLMYTYKNPDNGVTKYKQQRIFIRQGEEADYVYRPSESYSSSYGPTGTLTGTRTRAVKWSPYNLTDPARNTNYDFANRSEGNGIVPHKRAEFTRYPSQGGYYFSFLHRYAYCPTVYQVANPGIWPGDPGGISAPKLSNTGDRTNTSSNVSLKFPHNAVRSTSPVDKTGDVDPHELCPGDYRTPRDYTGWLLPKSTSSTLTTAKVATSEIRQSIFNHPVDGDRPEGNAPTDKAYENQVHPAEGEQGTVVGVYADGFMDRRKLYRPYCSIFHASMRKLPTAVALGGTEAAYIGRLLFNTSTLASIFFPYAGSLPPGDEWANRPYYMGDHAVYGTSTTHHDNAYTNDQNGYQLIYIGYAIGSHYVDNMTTVSPFYPGYSAQIRCVKE